MKRYACRIGKIGEFTLFRAIYENDTSLTLSENDDTAIVQGNNVGVAGGEGDDWLTTSLRTNERIDLSTTLMGGAGDDTLYAALTSDNYSEDTLVDYVYLTATLEGGSGDDEIGVDLGAMWSAQNAATISGGSGADTISVKSDIVSFVTYLSSQYMTAYIEVDGGLSADKIDVSTWRGSIRDIKIHGGSEGDAINTSGGSNTEIYGDSGNDTITAVSSSYGEESSGLNNVYGGTGNDYLDVRSGEYRGENTYQALNNTFGEDGNDTLILNALGLVRAVNIGHGGVGDDNIYLFAESKGYTTTGGDAFNEAEGGEGSDLIEAVVSLPESAWAGSHVAPQRGLNLVYGDAGNDRLSARITMSDDASSGDFHSELYGGTGNDRLKVSGGDENFLTGNQGNDTLLGSTGDDRMIGGQGDDYLKGYAGDDTFEFQSARNGERDRIDGFAIGDDLIDVSRIDANAWRGGNQSFSFDATGDGGTGKIWVEDYGTRSIVHADTGRAVLDIVLLDGRGVDASDYGASDFIL